MELMQLEMFVALVEERSFQRAAERVFRTVALDNLEMFERMGVIFLS
jgi:hypothetical protein